MKSSNDSWAAKEACNDYPKYSKREVIVTTMDGTLQLRRSVTNL